MDFSKEEPNLPSDSDDSDEDYVPSGAESNPPSEVESDGEVEDAPESEGETENGKKRKKSQKATKKKARKRGKKLVEKAEDNNDLDDESNKSSVKNLTEEEEKEHADSLWADFMKDTKTPSQQVKIVGKQMCEKEEKVVNDKAVITKTEPQKEEKENKVTITKVFEFAGEEVKVVKEVDATSEEARLAPKAVESGSSCPQSTKGRGRVPGGLSSVLGQLGKKNKLGTLEKSKLDWDRFKKNEGIEDELKNFNRGKDGYLEKQDFLQRTDLRQFEIEKGMRATRRSNR